MERSVTVSVSVAEGTRTYQARVMGVSINPSARALPLPILRTSASLPANGCRVKWKGGLCRLRQCSAVVCTVPLTVKWHGDGANRAKDE